LSDEPEWGPWIEHDGRGCQVEGQYVDLETFGGVRWEGIAGSECRAAGYSPNDPIGSAWIWPFLPPPGKVDRYRVRRPRGLTILEGLLADLPEGVEA